MDPSHSNVDPPDAHLDVDPSDADAADADIHHSPVRDGHCHAQRDANRHTQRVTIVHAEWDADDVANPDS